MSLDYKSIGNRIRLVRHRRRLSQAMLSELIDKTMSLETFVLIANALRVSPTQLLIEQLTCTEIHASKEITLLLSDCSPYETLVLLDVLRALKVSLRDRHEQRDK